MNGIVFFRSANLNKTIEFYTRRIGCEIWMTQSGCTIVKSENLLLGFCQSEQTEDQGVITFVCNTPEEVESVYLGVQDVAVAAPVHNARYRIFHFYGRDPDGRLFEVQSFDEPPGPNAGADG